jgi:hypothetical protein
MGSRRAPHSGLGQFRLSASGRVTELSDTSTDDLLRAVDSAALLAGREEIGG